MRYTIFVHNDCIHLIGTIFSFDPDIKDYKEIEYYAEICKDDIYFVLEDMDRFHIKLQRDINGDMDFSAYKNEMVLDEIIEFREWCKLNKQEIGYG